MAMIVIGGDGPKRKREMIGGPDDDYGDGDEAAPDESGDGMGMDAQKDEAVSMLLKALGVSPGAKGRVKHALEAFVYACKGE